MTTGRCSVRIKRARWLVACLLATAAAGWCEELTNGGFESCGTDATNWIGTGWTPSNSMAHASFAARTGAQGGWLNAWGAGWGRLHQDVPASGTGTYTFAMWTRQEPGFNPTAYYLRLEWYAADRSTKVQDDTVTNLLYLPEDGLWHHVHVSGVATAADLSYVRPVIDSSWGAPKPGAYGCFFDDAQLDHGSCTGIPPFGIDSFENGPVDAWAGTAWVASPEDRWGTKPWSGMARSGTNFVWLDGQSTNPLVNQPTNLVRQMVRVMTRPVPGAYSLSCRMFRDNAFAMSNAQLRIEYYDEACANKVQEDSVTNFVVPNDYSWREYHVNGSCTSPLVHEVRAVIQVEWDCVTNEDYRGARIDDVRFRRGAHDGFSVQTNWGYHGGAGCRAQLEAVPATNVGAFLQINYDTRTNTFFVLADSPTVAKYAEDGDAGEVGLRMSYRRPEDQVWINSFFPMTRAGTVEIADSSPFHGLPASGVKTADLWRADIRQPTNAAGLVYSGVMVRVYYAPYFRSVNGIVTTDVKYLVASYGEATNELGQVFSGDYYGRDYHYDHFTAPTWSAFTNGGFENPLDVTNALVGTGWSAIYDYADRSTWAQRSGKWGGFLPSWDAGSGGVCQNVATTGGTFQLSYWRSVQPGANPTQLQARMEWYNTNGVLVQENVHDIPIAPKGNDWTKGFLAGACFSNGLEFVRVAFAGRYDDGSVPGNESILFDDIAFEEVGPALVNGGFETGFERDTPGWYGLPASIALITPWAAISGTNGFAFLGWLNDAPQYEAMLVQPVVASAGVYTCSVWINLEANFVNLTNTELRLEWYSGRYPEKVQPDTVVTIVPPNDETWHCYAVTGECHSADLRIVQPVLFAQWAANPPNDRRAFKIDDFVLAGEPDEGVTDGIPNWWWERYFVARVASEDPDMDERSNFEEYVADTFPDDPDSFFEGEIASSTRAGKVLVLLSGVPTSTGRWYDVYWKTNLVDPGSEWMPVGLNVRGVESGNAVPLTVTNVGPLVFYRTGVRLP